MSGTQSRNVHAVLRERITKCELWPETRLAISEIASENGVSPGSVREALARLSAEGLVTEEEYKGYRVAPISIAEMEDLTRTLLDVEAIALKRSLANGDLEWELLVMAEFRRLQAAPVFSAEGVLSDDWRGLHNRFHNALVSACGSDWLLRVRRTLFEHAERYRYLTVSSTDEATIRDEHQRLTDAALARDAEAVMSILTGHIQITRNSVARLLSAMGEAAKVGASGG